MIEAILFLCMAAACFYDSDKDPRLIYVAYFNLVGAIVFLAMRRK